jgi:fluoroquinolone resistance protein
VTPVAGDVVFDQAFADEDWSEHDLVGAHFENCRFLCCGFGRADLREAVFKNCGFADAEGQQGANFAFARLDEATFDNCNLAHARFEGADLYAVRFADCRLLGARFGRARFHRAFGRKVVRTVAAFTDCNLDLADLSGVGLQGCDLSNSRFQEADLSGADLEGANLTRADLFHAILDDARLAGADLRDAEISGLDIRRLASSRDLKINADQQFALLDAMGIDVRAG